MRLTSYTDYALRVLIYLGAHPDRTVRTEEISVAYDISQNHLVKVVNHLGNAGWVKVKRGRGGGIVLGVKPEDIRLDEVVRECEPDLDLVECFDKTTNTCPIEPVCGLKPILSQATHAFLATLGGYSLADLLRGRRPADYRKRLGESAPG